jgi:lipopolysaccharide export LptBFGC system permease protein LptF
VETKVKSVVAILIAGGMFTAPVYAAPRAESAMECGVAADMAVVAHSLAGEQIQRQKAEAIMVRIYDVSESDRGKELMRDIIDAVYSKPKDASASSGGTSSQKFAEELFATCMESGGDMDPILGRRL